ncbi:hypothetical protein BGZ93_006215 [Podila epicladia]|nr:hypothetical protein BGZ93_006215 [Podila epicladia]
METSDEPVHVIIRLPYPRPEGYIDTQPVVWSEAMEKRLWQIIGQNKPTLVDWNAVSMELGNVPVKFLIQHATVLYQTQLQDLHRIGEQQHQQGLQSETAMSRQASTSSISRPTLPMRTRSREAATSPILPLAGEADQPTGIPSSVGNDVSPPATTTAITTTTTTTNSNPESASQSKAQASPSLSGSVSTFPSFSAAAAAGGGGRPPSMSSSASTIRPVQPPSPSPSTRNAESSYSSAILANRGGGGASTGTGTGVGGPAPAQPRSTRGSQLLGASHDRDKRAISVTNSIMQQLQGTTSPRDESGLQRIQEPAHPFHHGTLSDSLQKSGFLEQAYRQSSPHYGVQTSTKTSPRSQHGGMEQPVYSTSGYQDDRSSTISSASTPYSQSNSVSQIFEETSFFNQLSSNDSLSRGGGAPGGHPMSRSPFQGSSASSPFSAGAPPLGSQGRFGLGFVDTTLHDAASHHQGSSIQNDVAASSQRTTNMHRSILKADDNDTETSTDKDDDDDEDASHDESEPLRQQIKQLHLEDVLAFLPIGGLSASGVLPEAEKRLDTREVVGHQRRTALGDKMPFQLDAELADLGTRPLEEILNHNDDDGEENDHGYEYGRGDRTVSNKASGGIRFLDQYAGPGRIRGLGRDGAHGNLTRTSPERSGPSSRKSSAQNSVGSSFSDLSDSSVTQSAMEDAYLSGYNNSKL